MTTHNPMESQTKSNKKIFSRTDFFLSPPSWPLTSKLHYWGTLSYTTLPRKLQRYSKGLVAGDKILTWCLFQSKGQWVSKADCLVLIWTKNWTKLFFDFCPKDLKSVKKNNVYCIKLSFKKCKVQPECFATHTI